MGLMADPVAMCGRSDDLGEQSRCPAGLNARFAAYLFHKLIKHGRHHAIPRWQHKALQHSNLFAKFGLFKRVGSCLQSSPAFCRSGALAGKVARLPNQVNRAGCRHDDPGPSNDRRAIALRKHGPERSRTAEYLDKSNQVAGSSIKTRESLPVLTSEPGLQDQIISIRIYPHLIFHCSILYCRHRWSRRLLEGVPVLAWSSCEDRCLCALIGHALVRVASVCLMVFCSWSLPCGGYVGWGICILSRVGATANSWAQLDFPEFARDHSGVSFYG